MTTQGSAAPENINSLLAQAQTAGVRARLTADGTLELHGPPSAFRLGRELRAREAEVAALLREEALGGLHRVLGWRKLDAPSRTQGRLRLDDEVPRTPSGHPLDARGSR
jgi:hypothetical protein